MAEDRCERVLETLRGLLAGMTGPRYWGGAYANAPTVERTFRTSLQVKKFPHVCVVLVEAHTVQATQERMNELLRIELYGYARGTAAIPVGTQVNYLRRDAKLTLSAACQAGGALAALGYLESLEYEREGFDFHEQTGGFLLPLTLTVADPLAAI